MSEKPLDSLVFTARKAKLHQASMPISFFLDPEASFTVEKKNVHHRHKETPHEGRQFKGVVKRTYVRGTKVYEDGSFVKEAHGKKILSGRLDKVATNTR